MAARYRPLRLCGRCQRVRPYMCRGLCDSCHSYVRRPYVPTGAGRGGAGTPKSGAAVAGRLEDYAEIRSRHYTISQAAARLGITERTAWRYEARLRQQRDEAARGQVEREVGG